MIKLGMIINVCLVFGIQVEINAQKKQSDSNYIADMQEAHQQLKNLKILEKEYIQKALSNQSEEQTTIVKNNSRIQSIPKIALDQSSQLKYLNQLMKALESNLNTETKKELVQFIQGKSALEINQHAILSWYQDSEEESLYLVMKAAQSMPDSLHLWNNVAAMMNMNNMPELSIPILQYVKKKDQENVPVLNNLGQAYLGLGDVPTAEQYLKECLRKDVNHPEATRSMGVIEMSKGNSEEAAKYFEKDVKNHLRESSYDYLKKVQKQHNNRLSAIRTYYLSQKQYQTKSFYNELGLASLSLPNIPTTVNETAKWLQDLDIYIASLSDEKKYWEQQIEQVTEQEINFAIHKTEPYISWLVSASISELNEVFEAELSLMTDDIIESMIQFELDYWAKMDAAEYPEMPDLHDLNAVKAYNRQVCEINSAIMNASMTMHNGMIKKRFDFVNGQWKLFLNELINILELSPTHSNKKIAYRYISAYIDFLGSAVGSFIAHDKPTGCDEMTLEEAIAILKKSKRKLNMVCPEFLQYELPVGVVGSIKMSCSEFQIEGGPGIVKGGYRKKFTDQTSTLYIKVGQSIGTSHIKASAEVQAYLVFDKNNQLSNTGISTEAKLALPQGLAELSAGAKVEMNSGYSHEVKQDSRWIQSIKKTYSKY